MVRFVVLSLILLSSSLRADDLRLTEEQWQHIVNAADWLKGNRVASPGALADPDLEALLHGNDQLPICGTPIAADYMTYRHAFPSSMDADSLGERQTDLLESFDSPAGLFRIHYSTVDPNIVYQPNVRTNPYGVPDYVYWTAVIADSVYDRIVNDLGFPAPPGDGAYPEGDGSLYDIYLHNLPSGVLGLTYPDSVDYEGDSTQATSFMELDNDYSFLIRYKNNPLDIVRVTVAHEFFHAVQFGMDWRESSYFQIGPNLYPSRPWMEMTAVWMEEKLYDNINDYYGYLPSFFDSTKRSIEQFNGYSDLHPYASVVWPLFLTQYFNDDNLIRVIWEKCAELGYGDDVLEATQFVIDSISGGDSVQAGTENWATAFREFALWNYFTGERAAISPNNLGYEEKQNYPSIPDAGIAHHGFDSTKYIANTPNRPYPVLFNLSTNPWRVEHNASAYVRLEQTRLFSNRYYSYHYDYTPLGCDTMVPPNCTDSTLDSTFVLDPTLPYDRIDSTFEILLRYVANGNNRPWGLNMIYQLDEIPDSFIVDRIMLPVAGSSNIVLLGADNPAKYRSITFTLAQASDFRLYAPDVFANFTHFIRESSGGPDLALASLPGAVMWPYPNPAVVAQMIDPELTFVFQMPTGPDTYPVQVRDSINANNIVVLNPKLVVDIFTIAGEYVATLDDVPEVFDELGEYRVKWDMKNAAGRDVASGAYFAYARLFDSYRAESLLAEARVKVAVIR
jgi:hypothetical protein